MSKPRMTAEIWEAYSKGELCPTDFKSFCLILISGLTEVWVSCLANVQDFLVSLITIPLKLAHVTLIGAASLLYGAFISVVSILACLVATILVFSLPILLVLLLQYCLR